MAGPPRDDTPAIPLTAVLGLFGVTSELDRVDVVAGGWSHQVWRVQAGTSAFAIKQLRRERGDWWMDQLRAACKFEWAAWSAGTVAMAEPVEVEGGRGLLGELTKWSEDYVYRCHRWVSAAPCDDDPPSISRSRQVGAMVAALSALRFRSPGTTADHLPWNALDAFDDTVAEAHDRSLSWAADLQSLRPGVTRLRSEFRELASRGTALAFAHRDFDPKNAGTTPDGSVVLFDWDYAGPRLAASELLDVAISFAGGPESLERDCITATFESYRQNGGTPVHFGDAAPVIVEESFRWLMLNAWRAMGHRNVTEEQADFANSLVPELARKWPSSAEAVYRLAATYAGA
jgi:hypothetical protein